MRKHHSRRDTSHHGPRVLRTLVGLSVAAIATLTSFSPLAGGSTPAAATDSAPPASGGSGASGGSATPPAPPYWLSSPRGSVQAGNGAPDYGSLSPAPSRPLGAIAVTRSGDGYWLAGSDGSVHAFGHAADLGSALHPSAPIVAMAPTHDDGGYWLAGSDGGIFTFGDARFTGSAGALHLTQPIVAMAPTPDGGGYWLVARDGGVFTYGDARFHGSAAGTHLASPVVDITPTGSGAGYWLLEQDGEVLDFGAAGHFGAPARPAAPAQSLEASADSAGYWIADAAGHLYAFGDAASRPASESAPASGAGVLSHDGGSPEPLGILQPPPPPGDTADMFALAQVGKPYAYGASGPSAYDCSGLAYRSWLAAGVTLPRVAAQQYSAGSHVPVSQLRPGDLVFWGSSPARIYHVALYVGNGRVVNATHPGGSVTVMGMYAWGPVLPLGTRPAA